MPENIKEPERRKKQQDMQQKKKSKTWRGGVPRTKAQRRLVRLGFKS